MTSETPGPTMPLQSPSLAFQPSVPVFDANVGVGHRHDCPAPFDTPAQLLAELDRHGVERAVVYPVQGEAISPVEGNEGLAHWVEGGEGRLVAQYVVGAHPDSLPQLIQLRASGLLPSARLMDAGSVQVPVASWVFGEALAWLRAEGIPLWVSLADNPLSEVVETLGQYPGLDVVLVGATYTHASIVAPLLRHLPGARLELSRYEVMGAVEVLVREFGAGRFVYGSYYPRYAMGPVLHGLHHLDLPEVDVRRICCDNLDQLLRCAEHDPRAGARADA